MRLLAAGLWAGLALTHPAIAAPALDLETAVAEALDRHPRLKAADQGIAAMRAREVQAETWPNPNLMLMAEEVPFNSPGNGIFLAGVSVPLERGGLREARSALARAETRLAELDRALVAASLEAEVKVAYAEVLFQRQETVGRRIEAERAAAELAAAHKRYQAGESARVEVLRAEVAASRADRALAAERHRTRQAEARLSMLVGRSPGEPLTLAPLSAPGPAFPPLARLEARAIDSRLELQRAAIAIEREAWQRRLAQSSVWTGTEVTGAAGAVGGGTPGFSTTVTMPVPFYRQQGEIAEAEAGRARAMAERDAWRATIVLEVQEAYHDGMIAREHVALFTDTHLPQARRLVENAESRYRAGEGTLTDLAEARRALAETESDHQKALLAYQQARARLERAIGQDLAP